MVVKEASTLGEFIESLRVINNLNDYYPDFNSWYWNKVIPRIDNGICKILMGYKKQELVGISIIKKSSTETKLCALRVKDEFKLKGYSLKLIDDSLKRLDIDKPLCSVSCDMINDYSRIFINRYDFDLTHVYNGLYKKNKLEYEFNGNKKLSTKSGY